VGEDLTSTALSATPSPAAWLSGLRQKTRVAWSTVRMAQ